MRLALRALLLDSLTMVAGMQDPTTAFLNMQASALSSVVAAPSELAGGGDVSLAGLVGGDFGACGVGGYAALVLWGALSALAIFLHYKGYLGKGTHIDSAIRCIFQPVFLVNGLITAEFVGEEQAARLLEDVADEPPTPDSSMASSPLVEYAIAEAPADAPVAAAKPSRAARVPRQTASSSAPVNVNVSVNVSVSV